MGVFDKKFCDICGAKIGLLGNRKLDDGNLCKDCAAKLSPFFTGRRRSTVADIREQLAYREANKAKLALFRPTEIIGESGMRVYIDRVARVFAVTRSTDFNSANPDLIPLDRVISVDVDIKEDADEIFTTDAEGKEISYDPKQYEYEYTFDVTINVNCDFFSEIKYELSSGNRPDSKASDLYFFYEKTAYQLKCALLGADKAGEAPVQQTAAEETEAEAEPEASETETALAEGEWICPKCGEKNSGKFCMNCAEPKPVVEEWFCPKCGTKNTGKFCMNCATAKPVIEENPEWFCPKCGTKNSGKFCSNCATVRPF